MCHLHIPKPRSMLRSHASRKGWTEVALIGGFPLWFFIFLFLFEIFRLFLFRFWVKDYSMCFHLWALMWHVIPMAYNAWDNKTISYEVTNKNESTSDSYNVVIRFSLIIAKATKRVLPYSPNFFSQFVGLIMQLVLTQQKLNQEGSCVHSFRA